MAVCTHVLYTLILTVQLFFLSNRSEHRIHPGDTTHHTHTTHIESNVELGFPDLESKIQQTEGKEKIFEAVNVEFYAIMILGVNSNLSNKTTNVVLTFLLKDNLLIKATSNYSFMLFTVYRRLCNISCI